MLICGVSMLICGVFVSVHVSVDEFGGDGLA
jgi:hypothetical protein